MYSFVNVVLSCHPVIPHYFSNSFTVKSVKLRNSLPVAIRQSESECFIFLFILITVNVVTVVKFLSIYRFSSKNEFEHECQ